MRLRPKAFDVVYRSWNNSFDFKALERVAEQFKEGVEQYRGMDAYSAYTYYPDRPHCDVGAVVAPRQVRGISPFPGGVTSKSFGTDFAKVVHELSQSQH